MEEWWSYGGLSVVILTCVGRSIPGDRGTEARGSNVTASISSLRLDLGNECLWWGDQQVGLTPKAFQILRYLVEHRDRLVKKQSLLEAVWPDSYVEEGQVKQFIGELRRLLHDDPIAPRFIQTIRGRGYRWIGEIELRAPELSLTPQASRPVLRGPSNAPEVSGPTRPANGAWPEVRERQQRPALDALSHPPSIAVLPFRSVGSDPRDERLAEGLAQEVSDGFTRSRTLVVVPQQSALAYRDRQGNARRDDQEIAAAYVVDGTIWRRDETLSISINLIDTARNRTLWAEKLGDRRELSESPESIASRIVASIEPRVLEAEVARVRKTPSRRPNAYDCLLQASSLLYTFDERDLARAGSFLDRATQLDPNSARAYAYKAWWYVLSIFEGRSADPSRDTARAEDAVRRAMALDSMDWFVLAVAGHVQALLLGRPDRGASLFDLSLRLNDSAAFAWGLSAVTHCYLGAPAEALGRLNHAWQLSPLDPLNFLLWSAAGLAEFLDGHYDRALVWLEKALHRNSGFGPSHRTLTTCLWHAGREADARAAARDLLKLDPAFRISTFSHRYPLRRTGDLARYIGGLRAAGLPE